MASILGIRKGDIIVERVNGKKSMTPVRHVEFNACSKRGVHVNRNSCYDNTAMVDLVLGEETLGDARDIVEGISSEVLEAIPDEDFYEDMADKLVKV